MSEARGRPQYFSHRGYLISARIVEIVRIATQFEQRRPRIPWRRFDHPMCDGKLIFAINCHDISNRHRIGRKLSNDGQGTSGDGRGHRTCFEHDQRDIEEDCAKDNHDADDTTDSKCVQKPITNPASAGSARNVRLLGEIVINRSHADRPSCQCQCEHIGSRRARTRTIADAASGRDAGCLELPEHRTCGICGQRWRVRRKFDVEAELSRCAVTFECDGCGTPGTGEDTVAGPSGRDDATAIAYCTLAHRQT